MFHFYLRRSLSFFHDITTQFKQHSTIRSSALELKHVRYSQVLQDNKNKPWLDPCLHRRRTTQECATPCYSGCVILYYTSVINLDKRPPFGPTHTVQTRLKPLAQWCFYSYTYSNCSFSPRAISKSNFFFNRRKNWFKIAQAKPSWSHYFPRVLWKGQPKNSHVPMV